LNNIFVVDSAFGDISLILRIQDLVDAAIAHPKGTGVIENHQYSKDQRLQCFLEGFRREFRNAVANAGHFFELGLANRVFLLGGHFGGEVAIAVSVVDGSQKHFLEAEPELVATIVFIGSHHQVFELFVDVRDQTTDTFFYETVKVGAVPCLFGKHLGNGVDDPGTGLADFMFKRGFFRSQELEPHFFAANFPEIFADRSSLLHLFFGFPFEEPFAAFQTVFVNVIDHPQGSQIREKFRSHRFGAEIAAKQLMGINANGHLAEDFANGMTASTE